MESDSDGVNSLPYLSKVTLSLAFVLVKNFGLTEASVCVFLKDDKWSTSYKGMDHIDMVFLELL